MLMDFHDLVKNNNNVVNINGIIKNQKQIVFDPPDVISPPPPTPPRIDVCNDVRDDGFKLCRTFVISPFTVRASRSRSRLDLYR